MNPYEDIDWTLNDDDWVLNDKTTFMTHKTKNKYKVTFSDGTSFESSGSAEAIFKGFSLLEEFSWVSYHITKEVLAFGKVPSDITKIEYIMSVTYEQQVVG